MAVPPLLLLLLYGRAGSKCTRVVVAVGIPLQEDKMLTQLLEDAGEKLDPD